MIWLQMEHLGNEEHTRITYVMTNDLKFKLTNDVSQLIFGTGGGWLSREMVG
jgi:hypothetical protein